MHAVIYLMALTPCLQDAGASRIFNDMGELRDYLFESIALR
jgi:hypothetical protein